MAFNASTFKAGNPFGGARPSLFNVQVGIPLALSTDPKAVTGSQFAQFRVRTSQLPGRTISTSEVPYMGRTIKYNGAPTFEDWETTVYEDEDFSVHELITSWMNKINGARLNTMDPRFLPSPAGNSGFFANMKVTVMSKAGIPIKTVTMFNAWPTVLGATELDWSSNDEILNFPVTWAYSHWIASSLTDDDGVIGKAKGYLDSVVTPAVAGLPGTVLEG